MRFLFVILLLSGMCFAQDGISPDTVLMSAFGYYGYDHATYYTVVIDADCAWRGVYESTVCGVLYKGTHQIGGGANSTIAAWCNKPMLGNFGVGRGYALFNTADVSFWSQDHFDSCKVLMWLAVNSTADDCSLWVVEFDPHKQSDCSRSYNDLSDSCNNYLCGDGANYIFQKQDATDTYYAGGATGLITIDLDTSYFNAGDTTAIGFVARRQQIAAPTGINNFETTLYSAHGDSTVMIVYWFDVPNDISHQDNADGISPDTIQFICSVALDDISTPSYWTRGATDWNLSPSTDNDAFRGERMPAFCCDTSWCGQVNQAMQPHVEASFYGNSIYWMRRANFLMELEKPIPDTEKLDSMRFYCKFAYVHVDEGDSLFIVTYTPRDTSGDECYVNYIGDWDGILGRFTYPIIPGGSAAPTKWCNFFQCGDYKIWGDIPDRSYGRVPQYLAWTWFPIHPSIIDFTTASVGDTFGIGLILKDENSVAPTDTNDISIAVASDCPYIVYWFSEHEDTTQAGFINYGLKPPYLGWGLPINQPRRMYGGGRRP